MREMSEHWQEEIRKRVEGTTGKERQDAIILAIAADFLAYCDRNLMIKDKATGRVVPLEFNWAQRKLVELVLADLAAGRPVRYIVLKARQMGISTVIEALCFWWISTHRNLNAAIVAHEKDASVNLYKMFRRFYENAHPYFRPALKYNTKNALTFDVEDDVKQECLDEGLPVPGLGSEIATFVAKEDGGRSGTNHFVHGSEVGAWDSNADVVSSLLQTVPMEPNTFIFFESTAKGVGNYFFAEWMSAERGESQFRPFFLAWHDHADYELDESGGMPPYSDREKQLIWGAKDVENDPYSLVSRGYSESAVRRKIAWRRRKVKDFVRDPSKFDQEYPDSPMIAFLSSGNYAFPVPKLLAMRERARAWWETAGNRCAELKVTYAAAERKYDSSLAWVDDSPLQVFKEPVRKGDKYLDEHGVERTVTQDRRYVLGADVAEGIEVSTATGKEGDYSVADVMDAETYETVAKWRGHIDPDQFGDVVFDLGTYYNTALVGVEANNHGIVTIQKLKTRFYRNLYQREPTPEEQQFEHIRTTILGWMTNRKTKPIMVATLRGAIRDGDISDVDLVFLGEAMIYVSNERGVYGGKENGHDDTVMAKAIALQLADYAAYDVQYAKEHISKANPKIRKHGSTRTGDDGTPRTDRTAVGASRRAARAAARARR